MVLLSGAKPVTDVVILHTPRAPGCEGSPICTDGVEDTDGKILSRSVLSAMLGIEIERDYEKPDAYIEVADSTVRVGSPEMPHFVHAPLRSGVRARR